MAIHQTPGIGVSLVSLRHGVISRTYGHADLTESKPLDPESAAFPLASISKALVAVALLRAQDLALLSLDDAANAQLDFALPEFPGSRAIRLRDLARHEAGFEERWMATGAGATPDPRPWGEILASTQPKPIAPPGAYANYSNYGAALLSYVIERASGQPYHEFLKAQVTGPLGMDSTHIRHQERAHALDVAQGSSVRGGVAKAVPDLFNKRTHPVGDVVSTPSDMARLMRMLLSDGIAPDGRRILSRAAMSELFDIKAPHPEMPGMGILLAQKDLGGKRFIGHGGDGPAIHTDMILSPEDGFGLFIAFLSAPGPSARNDFARAIVRRAFPASRLEPLPLPGPPFGSGLSHLAGDYRFYRWTFSSIERLLQLTSEFRVLDSGRGTLVVRGRLAKGEYVPTQDRSLWRNRLTGEYLSFSQGLDGARLLHLGNYPFMTAYRLGWLDRRSTNQMAYSLFTWGAGGLAAVLAVLGLRAYLAGRRRASVGHGLLAACGMIVAWGTHAAVAIALGFSEAELQKAIPAPVHWLLALPFLAGLMALLHLGAVATGRGRPAGPFECAAQAGMLALYAAFLFHLNHWNALGWHYP